MTHIRFLLAAAFAAALLAPPAHAQMAAHGPAATDMMAGMDRMNRAMSAAPMTGDPDRDFVAMMLPHHQGAVDMARVEVAYGKDKEMRRLALAVIAAQDREIAQMRRWQARHKAP